MTSKLENLVAISNSSYLSELAKSPATANNQRLLVSLCSELLSESDNFGRLIDRAESDLRCSKETVRELMEEIECDDYISHLQEEEISSLNETVTSLSREVKKYKKLYESAEEDLRSSMESMAKPIKLRPLKFRNTHTGMMAIAAKSADNEVRIAGRFDPKIKTI